MPVNRWIRLDVVFLGGSGLYVLNRVVLKPCFNPHFFPGSFLHNHFNDLLLVPVLLPPCLWVYHALGLRGSLQPPNAREIFGHVILWSFFFEVFGPFYLHHGTADIWDAVSYAVGGAISWGLWHGLAGSAKLTMTHQS